MSTCKAQRHCVVYFTNGHVCPRVDHLIENHDYKFRVYAVNRMGQSLPLTGTDSVTAKDPYKKPDRPGKPTVSGRRTVDTSRSSRPQGRVVRDTGRPDPGDND